MTKLIATPKNFEQAVAVLKGRVSMRLGNNTYLEVSDADPLRSFIGVRLHSTYIVKFWPDGSVTLHTGGYYTVTTKERINQFITGRIYQKAYKWYYVGHDFDGKLAWDSPEDFTEGMTVNRAEVQA